MDGYNIVKGCGMSIDINTAFELSITRANRWHGGDRADWSALDWAGAMCGEAGEAANAVKKLKRLEDHLATHNESGRHYTDLVQAHEAICKEVADTILYGLLLMARVGCPDPSEVIRDVFNQKSEEYGFPERL